MRAGGPQPTRRGDRQGPGRRRPADPLDRQRQRLSDLAVRKRYECRAAPEQVFDALLDEAAMAQWMGVEAEIEPRPGGEITLRTADFETIPGTVVALERPRLVAFRWEVSTCLLTARIDLEPIAGGTLVCLEEAGFDDDEALCGKRDYLWSHWLIRLAVLAPATPLR